MTNDLKADVAMSFASTAGVASSYVSVALSAGSANAGPGASMLVLRGGGVMAGPHRSCPAQDANCLTVNR